MSLEPKQGDPLTARELQVLRLWRDTGGDEYEIARRLGLSKHTVHSHLANIRTKAGVHRTREALRKLAA